MPKRQKDLRKTKKKTGNMQRIARFLYTLGLMVFISTALQAQEVEFKATLSKTKVAKGGRLRVTFTINQQGGDNFKAPSFENFRVLSGPMSSINQSWINGKASFQQSYIYTISPQKLGSLNIEAASIEYGGKTIKSNPLSIRVVGEEELPKDPNDPDYIARENLMLRAVVSEKNPFVGEAVYVEFRLYLTDKVGVDALATVSSPKYNGFWSENIENRNPTPREAEINGVKYRYIVVDRQVLFPQRSGTLEIEPLVQVLDLQLPTNQSDFFGNRIMRRYRKELSSARQVIRVRDLPSEGQPENFNGAVGDFKFYSKANQTSLKAQESLTVEVEVTGSGNLKLFELPDLVVPSEIEVYDPEHSENIAPNRKGLSGSVSDTYTLVPQSGGAYELRDIAFSYFDPKTESYKTLQAPAISLEVSGGKSLSAGTQQGVDKQVIDTGISFKYIATRTDLEPIEEESFFGSTWYYILLFFPMLAIPVGIAVGSARAKRRADVVGRKRRKANRLARKYLSEARKNMAKKEAFYESLERALHNYLKAKLSVETTDIEKDNIRRLLDEKGVDSETIDLFIQVFDDCEFARYTPITDVMMKQEYEKAKEALSSIDKFF
jgi:hypothetical protein